MSVEKNILSQVFLFVNKKVIKPLPDFYNTALLMGLRKYGWVILGSKFVYKLYVKHEVIIEHMVIAAVKIHVILKRSLVEQICSCMEPTPVAQTVNVR